MFSEIRMGPAANGRGLCDIEHVLLRLPKSPKIGKAKLSVYFRRARTSQFFDTLFHSSERTILYVLETICDEN